MKFKRMIGLVASMALMLAPATAAVAKPVTSHRIEVSWASSAGLVTTNGSLGVTSDESGESLVKLQLWENGAVQCSDGSWVSTSRVLSYEGAVSLSVSVDRHLDQITIDGSIPATETVTGGCLVPALRTAQHDVSVSLDGTGLGRVARSRDSVTGTRFITRLADVTLDLGGVSITDQANLTKIIARG